jgi:cbb3-type cytochrome oxidase subunit 3
MRSIADVVSASGLHVYAEIALVLFFIAFATILTQVLTRRQSTWDRAARLPFDDDATTAAASTTAASTIATTAFGATTKP